MALSFRLSIAPERLALAALLGVTAGAAVLTSLAKANSQEIGVYSGRHYNTDKALYKQFTKKTGIKVKLLEAKDDALIERLKREGANSPADVLVLADRLAWTRPPMQGCFVRAAPPPSTGMSPRTCGSPRGFGLV